MNSFPDQTVTYKPKTLKGRWTEGVVQSIESMVSDALVAEISAEIDMMSRIEWREIIEAAKTNPAVANALEEFRLFCRLSKKYE